MKTLLRFCVAFSVLVSVVSAGMAGEDESMESSGSGGGLVAHYYSDPTNWNGSWPDLTNQPTGNPKDWTFCEYRYSRVEPVVNHLFIRRGWFSVRWIGWIDVGAKPDDATPTLSKLDGKININPGNGQNEFTLYTSDGREITRDTLADQTFLGFAGPAKRVVVRPKGNANDNALTLDGSPYTLKNGEVYDIQSPAMTVHIWNDLTNGPGRAMGQWWMMIWATDASIACSRGGKTTAKADQSVTTGGPPATAEKVSGQKNGKRGVKAKKDGKNSGDAVGVEGKRDKPGKPEEPGNGGPPSVPETPKPPAANDYTFEILADDGCRLFIDGVTVIDDWRACAESASDALRRSSVMTLTPGRHRIVVEYFQGQSLHEGDSDPMKLYWWSESSGIPRQIIRPSHFSHTDLDLVPPGASRRVR